MTHQNAGTLHDIFGINNIIRTLETLAEDHAPDIAIYEAEAAYTSHLESLLPHGWHISGNNVYRHPDAEDADTTKTRTGAHSGFDITPYIVDDGDTTEEPATPDPATHALHKMLEWQNVHDALTEALQSDASSTSCDIIARHADQVQREAIQAVRDYRASLDA